MIYVTGDCHADFRRFSSKIFTEQADMTKDDYMIICGDFGGIWYDGVDTTFSRQEKYWLDWLDSKSYTTLFVDGNHENHKRLNNWEVSDWHGGKVHKIRPSVIHLMRGEVYDIEGLKFFTFGGASSHDIQDGIIEMDEAGEWRKKDRQWAKEGKMYRIKDLSWWEEELPTNDEMKNGIDNLAKVNNEVDFIITHSPYASIIASIGWGLYKQDVLTKYLQHIKDNVVFKKWFCGHMHINEQYDNDTLLLYEQMIRIH